MITARSWYHDYGTVEIQTPFNAGFVDDLKYEIPASYREWNKPIKTWTVATPYDTQALNILRRYFPYAEIGERPGQRSWFTNQAHECSCDADHRALYICKDAPPEVVKAAYRVLAKANHPDRGGDSDRMQQINAAFERLTEEIRS